MTYGDSRVDMILSSDRVRNQEVDDFVWTKTSISHASKNLVIGIGWLWYGEVRCGASDIGPSCEELEAGASSTVGNSNCTCKLNAMMMRENE